MSSPGRTDGRRTAAAARRRVREAEILAATRALFDERGAGDAQIDDIAREVGVNRAIIYRHFSGKEELFALTVVDYLGELRARLEAAGGRTPAERLQAATAVFVDFGLEFPAFVDCAYALMRRPGPELLDEISETALLKLGAGITACLGVVVRALSEGNASGDFAVEDPVLLANTLYATGLGGMQLARVGMLVKEVAPGVPGVARLSPDQVREHLVASALAMATAQRD